MEEKEFFDLCEKTFKHYLNNVSLDDPFIKGSTKSRRDRTITEASKRHYAGRKLLENKEIFNGIKLEYVEKFLSLYPVNWSLFSDLTILNENIIEKYIDRLALTKIFENYKGRLSDEFIEKYNSRLGLIRRVELNLISISELMMVYPEASKDVKRKVKRIVESSNQYDDSIKLYIMLN